MEIKEISIIENKRRFACEFNLHDSTKLGISFLETEGLYDDIGVIGNFGPIRAENKNYIWGNFEMNNNESIRFNNKLKNNRTETLELLAKLRDISFNFFKQYPQYTCIVYKPLSQDQTILYNELIQNGFIFNDINFKLKEYGGFTYIYFGDKKEKTNEEDLFRVQRGDIRVKMFIEYRKISDEDLPNFFKKIEKIETEMKSPIFEDVTWE